MSLIGALWQGTLIFLLKSKKNGSYRDYSS